MTHDIIGDPQVNKVRFRQTNLAGLPNAVWILKIGPVVSEIGGNYRKPPPPPPAGRVIDKPQCGAGWTIKLWYESAVYFRLIVIESVELTLVNDWVATKPVVHTT